MGNKHKHYDVIVAWAAGEEIEYLCCGEWISQNNPSFHESLEWRIKPKRVKKQGWVNLYTAENDPARTAAYGLFKTKEAADDSCTKSRTACVHIEWEEQV